MHNLTDSEEDEEMSNGKHHILKKFNGISNALNNRDNEDNDENDDDDENDDGDDWNEMEQTSEPTKCLFCANVENSIQAAITHLNDIHGINLSSIISKFNMDQYGYIKVREYE